MGCCLSSQIEHDTEEMQDPTTENLIRNPVDDQPQQPGAAPMVNSLCWCIRDFFKKCFCLRWCIGESDTEENQQPDAALEENTLCQSIFDCFLECIFLPCSFICVGGRFSEETIFSEETDNTMISPTLPVSVAAEEVEDLIQNQPNMNKSSPLGETGTSKQLTKGSVFLYFTREKKQELMEMKLLEQELMEMKSLKLELMEMKLLELELMAVLSQM